MLFKVANLRVYMDYKRRLPCYP